MLDCAPSRFCLQEPFSIDMSSELYEPSFIYVAILIAFIWTFIPQPSRNFHLHQVRDNDGSVSSVLGSQSIVELLTNLVF